MIFSQNVIFILLVFISIQHSFVLKVKQVQKNEPSQNFPVSRFNQYFPDFSQTKFFKVCKCERCGSLNPRLKFRMANNP